MKLDGAVIKEQGQTFAIVVVKAHVLNSSEKDEARSAYSNYFPGMPFHINIQ